MQRINKSQTISLSFNLSDKILIISSISFFATELTHKNPVIYLKAFRNKNFSKADKTHNKESILKEH